MKLILAILLTLVTLSAFACPDEIAGHATTPLLRGKTLDQQALYEAMLLAREGDMDAQNRVLTALADVIPRQILAKMRLPPDRLDDVVQEILFRVVRNNFDFDINKGAYTTWMFWYIRACARIPKRKVAVLNASQFADGDEEYDFMSSVADNRPPESVEDLNTAKEALALLQQTDAQIISEHVMGGRTQKDVAEQLGLQTYKMGALVQRAKERLLDRVHKVALPELRPLIERIPLLPEKSRELFLAVSLDGEPLSKALCEDHGLANNWKECVRRYFVGVGFMADGLETGEIAPFWNAILEVPGPYQWVEETIVRHYLTTGEFPDAINTAQLSSQFNITPDRFFGMRVANPNSGPTSMRVFWGKDHLLWMFHRFLERAEQRQDLNKTETTYVRHFNPLDWGRPQQHTRYRTLAQEVFSARAYISQLQVIDAAIAFFQRNQRLPDASEELPQVCGIHSAQLFSYGKDYQAEGRWAGFGVFSDIVEYETMLEARRTMLLRDANGPEDVAWLEALGRARFTRVEYQTPLSSVFRYQFPVTSHYFNILTPLEQRAFLLRAEQGHNDEAVAAKLGVSREKAQRLCISGLARIEKHIQTQIDAKEARAFADELLDIPGPHRDATLSLVDTFAKSGRFPTEATISKLLQDTYGLSAKKLVGTGSGLRSEKLSIRLFFGIHHLQWSVLETMARQRKKLEALGNLTASQRKRLARFTQWTIHQMEVPAYTDAYTPLLLEFYTQDRERELQRLIDTQLDEYLDSGELPTRARLIEITGIHRERLFGGQSQRDQVRKFYFDTPDHYYEMLEQTRMRRLGTPTTINGHKFALDNLPILMKRSSLAARTPSCQVPDWLQGSFDSIPAEYQSAVCLRAIQQNSREEAARLLGMEAFAFAEIYLSALNTLARIFERSGSLEKLERFLAWVLLQPGPQRDFTEALVERFASQPEFLPTAETLNESLDWEELEFSRDQLVGIGLYGPNKRLARVFYGPFHMMWAYERMRSSRAAKGNPPINTPESLLALPPDPDFRPLAAHWKRNGLNVYSQLFEAKMEVYRRNARSRVLELAASAQSRPPAPEWLADSLGIPVEQLIGGKEYNQARPKGYLRIFDGQKDFDDVMSRLLTN